MDDKSASSPVVMKLPNNTSPQWWRDRGLRRLIFWQMCTLVTQMTVGYDESIVGSFQAMEPWIRDMGNPSASKIGLISTVVFIGGFCGAFVAPPVADHFGRRAAILLGSCLVVIGAVIQTAAQNSDMFIGGRLIIGFGISFTCCAGPSLINELAHPRMRGTIASMFNVLWYAGSIIAAWVSFGTGHLTASSWSWRTPSVIQAAPGVLVLCALPFIPESPRWLYSQGKVDEARQVLANYHANGTLDDALVELEMNELASGIAQDRTSKEMAWAQLLKSKANRKRFSICIAVALLTLWNGQGVISYYFSPILTSIGITSTDSQTGINGGLQIWNFFCALFGALLADRVGRRTLWLWSFIGMIACNVPLTISSAIYSKHGNNASAYTAVVFLFLYDAAFNIACNPLLYCYAVEILPYSIRARGLGLQIAASQAALTVNQYVNPIALDSIGYYYYIFYLGMLILGTAIIYFFFPETKGYTLEELSHFFEDPEVVDIEGLEKGRDANSTTKASPNLSVKGLDI
ncbi:related to hexose transporter protein [Phialocephala subalpina]|uniref:Related to hexose transporter protein n=1 Tax=Phialocephala subalpina TaxID=576137 RepID=A0A1L7WGE6_9HELO|nr:related to hexose transporter protein [Phialocephala subalpina]